MKRSTSLALIVFVQALLFTVGAFAAITVSPPHYDEASGFVCATCHTTHLTLGSTGYNNVCQSCHRPGDPEAGTKPITLADAANPFGIHSTTGISKMYQTSHRWDGSDTNPAAGAQSPVQAQMTTNGLRARTGEKLACVRCHNQHSNSNGNFLRIANDQDQMCLDCHRSRNTADHTKGSHPVGVAYPTNSAAFNAFPLNSNPANSSSAMKLLGGTTVSCSTCHGVHGTDSRSGTVDGTTNFANLSSGDGNLLRTDRHGTPVSAGKADRTNLCTNCHTGKTNHNKNGQDVQCADCHGAHVEYDAAAVGTETTPNIYLVRRYLEYSTAGRLSKRIIYNSTTTKNFYSSTGGGVCQSCHNPPPNHLSGTAVEPGHLNCASCHSHNEAKGSFSVGAGACGTCHLTGTSVPPLATGSHTIHFVQINGTDPLVVCTKCHVFTGDTGPTHNNGTKDVTNGCSACHGQGTPTWGATYVAPGDTFPFSTSQCDKCHSGTSAAPFYSTATPKVTAATNAKVGAHTAHLTAAHSLAGTLTCVDCHGAVTSVTSANHMNGTTDFIFSALAKTGGLNPAYNPANGQCANTYCHGTTLTGGGSSKTPGWTQTLRGCDTCHGFPPTTVRNGAGTHKNDSACNSCHPHVNSTNNGFTAAGMSQHINGQVDVSAGSCDSCHGYPPASSSFKGTQNNWSSARTEDYVGGGGAHTVNNHVSKTAKPADGFTQCDKCHNVSDHKTGAIFTPSQFIKVNVNQSVRFEATKLARYTSNRLDGPAHVPGNCSNISCHFGATPAWDQR